MGRYASETGQSGVAGTQRQMYAMDNAVKNTKGKQTPEIRGIGEAYDTQKKCLSCPSATNKSRNGDRI